MTYNISLGYYVLYTTRILCDDNNNNTIWYEKNFYNKIRHEYNLIMYRGKEGPGSTRFNTELNWTSRAKFSPIIM